LPIRRIYEGSEIALIPKGVEVELIVFHGPKNKSCVIEWNGKRYSTLTRLCRVPPKNDVLENSTTQCTLMSYTGMGI